MKNTFSHIIYTIFFIILAIAFLKFLLVAVVILLVFLWLRTFQMKKEPNQTVFLQGNLPNPKPDGFYHGTTGFDTSWTGKKFNAQSSTGINVFKKKQKPGSNQTPVEEEKYPFKTYTAPGLFDERLFVVKIDYNVKQNPFWVRWILDEIVEIAPGQYLGKVNLRILPGLPFSVLYFELKK